MDNDSYYLVYKKKKLMKREMVNGDYTQYYIKRMSKMRWHFCKDIDDLQENHFYHSHVDS